MNYSAIPSLPLPTGHRFKDLTGKRFNHLLVLNFAGLHSSKGISLWQCKCDCGNICICSVNIVSGHPKSCGCIRFSAARKACTKHGESNVRTPEFTAYCRAKNRCNNPNNPSFPNYGGRGIEFRFESYKDFLADVERRPTPKHSLDRIDNDGHYEKGNLRWAMRTTQNRNRRSSKTLTSQGITKSVIEWSNHSSTPTLGCIWRRIYGGWCDECILTIPSRGRKCPHKTLP